MAAATKTRTARKSSSKSASKPAPKSAPASDARLDELAERARALNEQIIGASRKAGHSYLDAYERSLEAIADSQANLAKKTENGPAEFIGALLSAQAEFTRESAKTVTRYYRDLLK